MKLGTGSWCSVQNLLSFIVFKASNYKRAYIILQTSLYYIGIKYCLSL